MKRERVLTLRSIMIALWQAKRKRNPSWKEIQNLFHGNAFEGFRVITNLAAGRRLVGEMLYAQNVQYDSDPLKWNEIHAQRDQFMP